MHIHRNTEDFIHDCRRCRCCDRNGQDGRERGEPFMMRLEIPGERAAAVELLDGDGRVCRRSVCRGGTLRVTMD
ncbi:MAG: hypothetical protein LBH95_03490 [Oscillospiraceae bacterium]|nr:hypothetical protein [Oscillospiraceae bacterium]